jgi:hypothetical protein
MDPKAIYKAKSRLRIAEKSLAELETAKSHQEFEDVWYSFLVAARNVYSALELGAKSTAQARQWFGGKKEERKRDSLLQYVFQARHDDEHGLEPVTELAPGSIAVGKNAPGFSTSMTIRNLEIVNGHMTIGEIISHDGKPVLIEQTPPHTKLATVTGRGGIKFPPPSEHLGKPLESNLPIPVGRLCLAYLQALVSEAEGIR